MESPSAPAHRGLVPWQGLLLAASFLTFWSLPSTAQFTMESVLPNAAEGKEVLLRFHNLPGDLKRYAWYKGEVKENNEIVSYVIETQTTIHGPAYSGRETIYPNGSLLLQKVTVKDTGEYNLQVILKDYATKQVTGQLHVYLEQTFTDYSVVGITGIVGIVIGVFVMVALGAFLGYCLYLRRTRRASDPRDPQVHPPPAAIPGQGPTGTSVFQGSLPNTKTAGPIYEELLKPNTDVYCRISPRADVAS
uniref:Immunoglobulin V-set domain-containing protein n=1 Tax=Pipistrellus kuhlii TaxID=59472 RepID=A0A7J7SP44_PIPKU|nr:hypothetical protein mPipKuh1_002581 [Pipistrellus kuhlii]